MYKQFFKRIIDFILALIGIILLSPIFLIITIIIKFDSKGPVLFTQRRVGKDKTYFNIYKFRTMTVDTPKEVPTHLLENAECCITRSGRILRKTSLDELPQLFNILRGDMAIIGPRPALWNRNQYDLIEKRDKYRVHTIRPGLTGLAQINGRDELSIEYKVRLDREYTNNLSFFTDLQCFFMTFKLIWIGTGIIEGKMDHLTEEEKKNSET
ncbi:sugar transferase [Melissococcus plutonius]|uniref:sugar transferase n=1 Tax=Melissococcus plutonius TaxID=33970 RepID=UPI003C2C0DD5